MPGIEKCAWLKLGYYRVRSVVLVSICHYEGNENLSTIIELAYKQCVCNTKIENESLYVCSLLQLALQPTVGFGPLNNILPFFPLYHQLSPSSHSQHLKISFSFFHPFLGLPLRVIPSSSWVKIFFGILSSSILSR